ncbi:hypothetical protein DSM26151_06420 [Agromyces marinus]|nr:hypothetical protein DSM26151_06420 [Agromyces marinus]
MLNEILRDYDNGTDRYLTRVDPGEAMEATRVYQQLLSLDDAAHRAASRVGRRVRLAFWFALAFAIAMVAACILAMLKDFFGLTPAHIFLYISAGVFLAGAILFLLVLAPYRAVQKAELQATQAEERTPSLSIAAEALELDGD